MKKSQGLYALGSCCPYVADTHRCLSVAIPDYFLVALSNFTSHPLKSLFHCMTFALPVSLQARVCSSWLLLLPKCHTRGSYFMGHTQTLTDKFSSFLTGESGPCTQCLTPAWNYTGACLQHCLPFRGHPVCFCLSSTLKRDTGRASDLNRTF